MSDIASKSALRKTWESAATGWAKWEAVFSAGLGEATDTMLEMAGVGPGMRVLDVACGAGDQAIRAARRVGPDGRVMASDISAEMLRHLRRSAAGAGVGNIETLECAADDLDDTLAPFDASFSRLGLMLFPSPPAALTAVRRVLKPRARFAAMVFTTPASNPFFSESMAILLRRSGKLAPPSGSPGLFALGADGALAGLMAECGLQDVKTACLRVPLRLQSVPDTLEMMQQAFGAYRAVLADLDDAGRRAAWAEVAEFLKGFETHGRFETESEVVIGSGATPK